MNKKLKNYEVLVKALDNFSLVSLDINVLNKKGENVFKKIKESTASGLPVTYLSFIEENGEPFTLCTGNYNNNWDGTLYYSTDTQNWKVWSGYIINSSADGKLYLRGKGNTKITADNDNYSNSFLFEPRYTRRIQCIGNIENLLDYKTVASGKHPVMADQCYYGMFYSLSNITKAPELPATTLSAQCYSHMFEDCSHLTKAPELPATTLTNKCYYYMFSNCSNLTEGPEQLPATTLADKCYYYMFDNCGNLTGKIHCPSSISSDNNKPDESTTRWTSATIVYDL